MPRGRTIPTDVRRKIREEVNAGTNRTDIAMKYGISEAAVSKIANERIESVANQIVNAIEKKPHVRIIDWRYRLLVAGWQLLPHWVWRRLPLCRPY